MGILLLWHYLTRFSIYMYFTVKHTHLQFWVIALYSHLIAHNNKKG
jgi:hypothetical protein